MLNIFNFLNIFDFFNKKLKKDIYKFRQEMSLFKDENLKKSTDKDIDNFLDDVKLNIKKKFLYKDELEKIREYEKNKKKFLNFKEIFSFLEELNSKSKIPINLKYWKEQIKNYKNLKLNEKLAFKELLIKELYKNLEALIEEWQKKLLEEFREEFNKKFVKRLEAIKKLQETLLILGFGSSYLWGLFKGEIFDNDTKTLLKWIDFFKNNEEILKLCDLLGRMLTFNKNKTKEKILSAHNYKITVPTIDSKEEISGIKVGKILENVIPTELSSLNDAELEILFDLKFIEEKLMIFDFQGYKDIEKEEIIEEEKEAEEEEKGPVILCVDTSGSMAGKPETIAKAIAFIISSKAISEKRKCLIINFSVNIEVIELSEISSFSELIGFLKKSFHGGTDIYPALEYSLKKVKEENFQKSDILILSDFILSISDKKTVKKIEEAKLLENKFYSICISGYDFPPNNMDSIFTKQWNYNYQTSNIELLNDIALEIGN